MKKNARAQRFAWLPAIVMFMALAGCQKAFETNVEAPVAPASAGKATATKPELPPLFNDIEHRTFRFFWDTTNPDNGLTPDGSIGFKQLDLAVEKRWNTGSDLTFKVRADLINAFNWRNWTSFDTNYGPAGGPLNPNLGSRNGNAIQLPTQTFKLSFGLDW